MVKMFEFESVQLLDYTRTAGRPRTETEFATVVGNGLETVWCQTDLEMVESVQGQRVYDSKIGVTGNRKDPSDQNSLKI